MLSLVIVHGKTVNLAIQNFTVTIQRGLTKSGSRATEVRNLRYQFESPLLNAVSNEPKVIRLILLNRLWAAKRYPAIKAEQFIDPAHREAALAPAPSLTATVRLARPCQLLLAERRLAWESKLAKLTPL